MRREHLTHCITGLFQLFIMSKLTTVFCLQFSFFPVLPPPPYCGLFDPPVCGPDRGDEHVALAKLLPVVCFDFESAAG